MRKERKELLLGKFFFQTQTVFPRACGQFKMVTALTGSSFKSRKKERN